MGVDASSLTNRRIARAREGLRYIREVIPKLDGLDTSLAQRLRVRVDLLAGDLEKYFTDSGQLDTISGNRALAEGEDLVAEALACVTAAAASWLGLGGETISLAQSWLDRLSRNAGLPQVGLVVPASSEFTGMQSQVIRLLAPNDGVWALPVAIHEYGHFVASVLQRREQRDELPDALAPVEKLLHETATADERPKSYWHGHELFADAFAAAVAGPAYTLYCIEYRFDPELAYADDGSHPSPARRMDVQLQVLERLGGRSGEWGGYLSADAKDLRKTWQALLARHPAQVPAADTGIDDLQRCLIEFVLGDPQISLIHYRDHTTAHQLAEKLPESCPARATPAIIINAAWVARMKAVGTAPGRDNEAGPFAGIATCAERLMKEACANG